MSYENRYSFWQGFPPPQHIYTKLQFKGVALEPPNTEAGSWIGGGKALYDFYTQDFLLTGRPRKISGEVRGYAANIYRSRDGVAFDLCVSLSKEELMQKSGLKIYSIEGTQLLKDPLTGRWHFYLSVDTGTKFVWGGDLWETLLLTSEDLQGPWDSKGLVIRRDQSFDSRQARDGSIDIIDGRWMGLCKAVDHEHHMRMQLITSTDGIQWKKHGVLTINGKASNLFFCSGSIFSSNSGPIFLGIARSGSSPSPSTWQKYFAAYRIDDDSVDLATIFQIPWKARSPFEHHEYPLHGYSSSVYDPLKKRILLYVDAIGPESIGPHLNEKVERVLVFECTLFPD